MSVLLSPAFSGVFNVRPRSKFGAKRVRKGERADGKTFDSRAEARRYDELRLMERAGEIVAGSIRTQVRYQIEVNGVHVCAYVADFVYRRADGVECCEDTKGVRTPVFALKKKLMRAVHGVEILETGAPRKTRRRKP